jgi:hypothetical protein
MHRLKAPRGEAKAVLFSVNRDKKMRHAYNSLEIKRMPKRTANRGTLFERKYFDFWEAERLFIRCVE